MLNKFFKVEWQFENCGVRWVKLELKWKGEKFPVGNYDCSGRITCISINNIPRANDKLKDVLTTFSQILQCAICFFYNVRLVKVK